jgi:CRP/FNR family cyclic AMP-dependent transcriptional regulator
MRTRISKQELEMLGRVPLFSSCSQAELRQIAMLGTAADVPAGKVLIREGQPGREFFMVLEGEALCTISKRKLAVFGPGDYFGELALLQGGVRTASVTASTPMKLVVLHASEFSDLIHTSPTIALKMLASLSSRLGKTTAELAI